MVEAEEMEGTVGEVHLRLLGTMEEVEVEDLTAAGVVAAHMEEVEEEEDLTAERVVVVVVDTEARKAKEAEVATVEVEAKAAEAVDMEVRNPEGVRSLEVLTVEEEAKAAEAVDMEVRSLGVSIVVVEAKAADMEVRNPERVKSLGGIIVVVEAKAAEAVDMEVRSPEVVRSLEGGIVEEVVDTASETFSLVSRSPFHEATLTKCIAPAIFTQCKFIVYLSLGRDTDFQFHQHCERRGMGLRMCRFRQRS